jgi:hypothetical protein
MNKEHAANVANAQKVLKSFATLFEKVLGPVALNYTAPIAKVLEVEAEKVAQYKEFEGLSPDEIEAKKVTDRAKALEDMVEAANKVLADRIAPKVAKVVEEIVEEEAGVIE